MCKHKIKRPDTNKKDTDASRPVAQTTAALYSIERQAGQSVQANLLAVWVASITYSTAAWGVYAFLLSENGIATLASGVTPVAVLMFLPVPACALASYHVITFGIGAIRSQSIGILEQEVISYGSLETQSAYLRNLIASKAETQWTNFGNASVAVKGAQAIAFVVPLAAALALSAACVIRIGSLEGYTSWWCLLPGCGYLFAVAVPAWLGIDTVRRLDGGNYEVTDM